MPDLTAENLQLFLVFVVPGFVALRVYGLLVPGDRAGTAEQIVEAVTFSMVNLGLMSWAVFLLRRPGVPENHPVVFMSGTVAVLVVSPALLAVVTHRIRSSRFLQRWILHPAPSAWDFFFTQRQACFILFHLKGGKRLGGYYGLGSFASAHPRSPNVFVERLWRVDEFNRFSEEIPGSAGCIIRYDDCELVEIFAAKEKKE